VHPAPVLTRKGKSAVLPLLTKSKATLLILTTRPWIVDTQNQSITGAFSKSENSFPCVKAAQNIGFFHKHHPLSLQGLFLKSPIIIVLPL
jgi:hypothetical protein